MLMREPGSQIQLGSHLPDYHQDLEPLYNNVPPPFELSKITPEDLAQVSREQTYRALIGRQNAEARAKTSYWLARAALIPAVATAVFFADQQIVAPLVQGTNRVQTHLSAENNYKDDGTGTLVLTVGGAGVKNSEPRIARPLLASLSDHIPNSRTFALDEGTFLHLPNTYETVRKMVEENPTDHVILWGMSMGGLESLFIAADLRESYPDLQITIFLNSTPFNSNSAYQLRKDPELVTQSELMASLQLYGGPVTNSLVDITSEATRKKYINADGTLNADAYWAEWGRIARDIWNSDGTPTSLRVGQVAIIASNKVEDNLTTIADDDPKLPPITINYIANGNDQTVDVEDSLVQFRSIANTLDMRFAVIRQAELAHASENDNSDIYNQNITIALDNQRYFEYQYAMAMKQLAELHKPTTR